MPVHKANCCEFKDPAPGSKGIKPQEVTDNPERALKDFMGQVQSTLSSGTQKIYDNSDLGTAGTVPKAKKPVDDVDAEDKREYIRTMLAGERFSKSYSLFGGVAKVTLQTRTVVENEQLRMFSGDGAKYNKAALQYSLRSLTLVNDNDVTDVETSSLDNMNDVLYSALISVFRKFERLCDTLFRKADDVNFWRGTGGPA